MSVLAPSVRIRRGAQRVSLRRTRQKSLLDCSRSELLGVDESDWVNQMSGANIMTSETVRRREATLGMLAGTLRTPTTLIRESLSQSTIGVGRTLADCHACKSSWHGTEQCNRISARRIYKIVRLNALSRDRGAAQICRAAELSSRTSRPGLTAVGHRSLKPPSISECIST